MTLETGRKYNVLSLLLSPLILFLCLQIFYFSGKFFETIELKIIYKYALPMLYYLFFQSVYLLAGQRASNLLTMFVCISIIISIFSPMVVYMALNIIILVIGIKGCSFNNLVRAFFALFFLSLPLLLPFWLWPSFESYPIKPYHYSRFVSMYCLLIFLFCANIIFKLKTKYNIIVLVSAMQTIVMFQQLPFFAHGLFVVFYIIHLVTNFSAAIILR